MIPIFIPYLNRPDLLRKAVSSIPVSDKWNVEVINNSGERLPYDIRAEDWQPPVPLTFAQSQQWMMKLADAGKFPYYLFLHSDAEAGEGTVEALIDKAATLTKEGTKWSVLFTSYDSLAAFNTEAFLAVGGWDYELPWYYGDCSVYRKLRLAGYPTFDTGLEVKHTPSQTLNSDPRIRRYVEIMTPAWRTWYCEMWGGDNEHEVYTVPFNGRFEKRE